MSSWCYIFDMLLLLVNELINSIIINFIHKQRSYHKHNSNLHTRHIKITALRHIFCPLIYNVHILHTITSSLSWYRNTIILASRLSSAGLTPTPLYPLSLPWALHAVHRVPPQELADQSRISHVAPPQYQSWVKTLWPINVTFINLYLFIQVL